ncbi:MAG TPA: hypothetical protein VGL51_03000, partial [Solirubrobacteraceae bacterium]
VTAAVKTMVVASSKLVVVGVRTGRPFPPRAAEEFWDESFDRDCASAAGTDAPARPPAALGAAPIATPRDRPGPADRHWPTGRHRPTGRPGLLIVNVAFWGRRPCIL